MYANFGELGDNIKAMVEEYQRKVNMNRNIASIGTCAGVLTCAPYRQADGTMGPASSVVLS